MKEIRVYVVNAGSDFDFREAEQEGNYNAIVDEAEEQGTTYSLKGFQEAVNNDEVSTINSFILIAEVDTKNYTFEPITE